MKTALITGVAGQDGSYLAELLLAKGYQVHGIEQRVALEDPAHRMWRLTHIQDDLTLHAASLESYASIFKVIEDVKPDECYHLASNSYVSYSFDDDFSTINTNINGTYCVLSAIREKAPECRFYFAASSEILGNTTETPQNEQTPFRPRSLYGISKLAGFHITRNYREAFGLFACNGILFNHESERRGFEFVTRKVSMAAARAKLGVLRRVRLGNLDARRDWGYSPDYVRAMWLMLQQDSADDYVIASGELHSVRELVETAFSIVDMDWHAYVEIDQNLYRPSEALDLCGDASKARRLLGWEPAVSFDEMIRIMVEADIQYLRKGGLLEDSALSVD